MEQYTGKSVKTGIPQKVFPFPKTFHRNRSILMLPRITENSSQLERTHSLRVIAPSPQGKTFFLPGKSTPKRTINRQVTLFDLLLGALEFFDLSRSRNNSAFSNIDSRKQRWSNAQSRIALSVKEFYATMLTTPKCDILGEHRQKCPTVREHMIGILASYCL